MYCAKPPCIEARLLCRIGLYATSPLDISAFIRDGLVCKFGFYPRLYGMCFVQCIFIRRDFAPNCRGAVKRGLAAFWALNVRILSGVSPLIRRLCSLKRSLCFCFLLTRRVLVTSNQARPMGRGGVRGVRTDPLPQVRMVHILDVRACSTECGVVRKPDVS